MNTFTIFHGLPGSGKSTLANKLAKQSRATVVERDIIRADFPHMNEDEATEKQRELIADGLRSGDVISSDTNLNPRFLADLIVSVSTLAPVKIEHVYIDTPPDECITRNLRRGFSGGRFVPDKVMRSFIRRYWDADKEQLKRLDYASFPVADQLASLQAKYEANFDSCKPVCLIDVDGTLADNSQLARECFVLSEKKQYQRFYESLDSSTPVREDVVKHIRGFANTHNLVILTGRKFTAGLPGFLDSTGLEFAGIVARPDKFHQQTVAYKLDVLGQLRASGMNVEFAFDDHPKIVDALNKAGVKCFQA